ncbi:Histidine kinase-, DNA gyrase B-, and HSP90-like ATPase [Nocardioides sp. YR527]|uniref:sensor histidine kinase n=1 Tax=Nocardioides sp. YR527 TaxID=1881028 RepID=UPI0008885D4A|nr:GAF domain-containing protein [Nocardioides sp. YR527]SDK53645.1 Histidine kinase-, DNA gyrase B-, and HSP90-like ATPase [Nocardioides sp. YR527]
MGRTPPRPRRPRDDAAEKTLSNTPLDELLTEVLDRVTVARDEQVRWRLLLDAIVTMGAGLSIDDLLNRIVEVAKALAGAKYAALGVLASGGERRLRLFITRGLTPEQELRIGDLPTGHGLLGLLIDHPEPVRLHDIEEHPASYGFPAHHPPMRSFLGVPVRIGEKVFGNLYLTEKTDGAEFTDQDESIVVALAAAAGVAIENALLAEEAARRSRWLDARAEITNALMGDIDRGTALQLVVDRAREISGADVAWIVTGPAADRLRVEVVSGTDVDVDELKRAPLRESVAGRAISDGVPMVVEDIASAAAGGSAAAVIDMSDLGPGVLVPLGRTDPSEEMNAVGVLALTWRRANAEQAQNIDLAVADAFAGQVALAIRLAQDREGRQRLAVYDDRDRIGRDLHDIVIQRLFVIGLRLQGGLNLAENPKLRARLDQAVEDIDDTIRDLRRAVFELGAPAHSGDIQSQVTDLVNRAAASLKFRPRLDFRGPIRLRTSPELAKDVVAVLGEALSNTVRHADASEVEVSLSAADDLVLRVRDDGRGIPEDAMESGLANMRHRAEVHGGRCTVEPATPKGTLVEWSVPLG